jgi:hypothetical protein
MSTAVILDFGPGRFRFHLPMKRILEVERECGNKSILAMYSELSEAIGLTRDTEEPVLVPQGTARILDVYHVIRCAAFGGGERQDGEKTVPVSAIDAKQLVDEYVDGRPYAESFPTAWAILRATIEGVSLKKKPEPEPVTDPKPLTVEQS